MTEAAEEFKEPTLGSPGAMLRQLREARGFSIAEVAQRLKYGRHQIEALERDDFGRLPGLTFVRGMIRGYAKLLGTDPQAVLQKMDCQQISNPMAVDLRVSHIPFPDGKKKTTRAYVVLSILLVVAAVMIGYELLPWPASSGNEIAVATKALSEGAAVIADTAKASTSEIALQPEAVTDFAAPIGPQQALAIVPTVAPIAVPAPVSTPSAVPSIVPVPGSKKILLQFDQESWVEIKQANDGKTLLSQLNPGGSRQIVEGIPPFLVIIGNAPNVRLSYNGQPVDLRPHFKIDVARFTLE